MNYSTWTSLTSQIINELNKNSNIEQALLKIFTPKPGITLSTKEIKNILKTPNMIILKDSPREFVSSIEFSNIFNSILYNQLELGALKFSNDLLQKWIIFSLTLQKEYVLRDDINMVLKSIYGYISSTRVQSKVFTLSKCENNDYSFNSIMTKLRNLFLNSESSVYMESRIMYFNDYIPTKIIDLLLSNNIEFETFKCVHKSELQSHKNYVKRYNHLNKKESRISINH